MKAKTKISLIIIVFIVFTILNTKVYAKTGTTTNDTTRIRTEASTSSDTVTLLSVNTEVEIISEEGEWYKVKYSSYTGYIRKDLLSVSEEETSTGNETNNETENQNETNSVQTQTEENTANTENTANETNENENNSQSENETENVAQVEETSTTTETIEITVGYNGILETNTEIRILPTINSSIIAEINENTEFTVKEIINKWCYIETENYSGWIFLSKIEKSSTQTTSESVEEEAFVEEETESEENEENIDSEEENETNTNSVSQENATTVKYVSTETLNMREEADNSSTIIAQLSLNTEVTVIEEVDSSWAKITYNSKTGYVASKYLSDTKVTTTSRSENTTRSESSTLSEESSSSSTASSSTNTADQSATTSSNSSSSSTSSSKTSGSDIVTLAKKYLGYKYVSGGASPETGFDCSGFTYYIYKQFGITLSRTSSGQSKNGTEVSKSDLQLGDIIIFNNSSNSSIGHVGIYIGSNKFIHAANSSKGVITTSLSDSYYSARYVVARRIL